MNSRQKCWHLLEIWIEKDYFPIFATMVVLEHIHIGAGEKLRISNETLSWLINLKSLQYFVWPTLVMQCSHHEWIEIHAFTTAPCRRRDHVFKPDHKIVNSDYCYHNINWFNCWMKRVNAIMKCKCINGLIYILVSL